MFAVIKTGGKQYRVAENDVITVERVAGEAGDMVEFGEVLMVSAGVEVSFGAPAVAGALVTAEIVEQFRDAKVLSFKKRRRQNSKRIRGHRQMLTSLRISEILTDGAKPSKKAAAKKPAKAETAPATETAQVAAPVAEKAEKKAPKAKAAAEKPADDKPAAPKKAAKPKAAKKEDKGE